MTLATGLLLLLPGPVTAFAQEGPPECLGVPATIVGTDGDDTLTGTEGNDVIVALSGNDRIDAGAGDDVICSGPDETATADDDHVIGGDGSDAIVSGAGNDHLSLGAGADYAIAGSGYDDVRGGPDDDYVETGDGPDVADGGPGLDYIDGGSGPDTISSSGGGADYLDGGPDIDTITGGTETAFIAGGTGNDRIETASGYVDAGDGADTVAASGTTNYVEGQGGADVLVGPGYLDGGPGDDALTGLAADGAYLDGGDGDDLLTARGAAVLDGGPGADRLDGGRGDDDLDGGPGDDVLDGGVGADQLRGSTGDDELRGRGGQDNLDGGPDGDLLVGGPDPDAFDGGTGTDTLRAVDDGADLSFTCGLTFESDRLVVDAVADAEVPRIACEAERPREYTPRPTRPPVGAFMVALGDSFSSGEGTGIYDDSDIWGYCHRGALAWPRRFGRKYLGLLDGSIDHRACTGARAVHLLYPWTEKLEDPQIHSSVQARTEIVTLTIGGNDLGFSELLTKVRISVNDGPPSPTIGRAGTERQIRSRLRNLDADLRPIYREMRRTYPNARIIHVGYPRILPSLDEPRPDRCEWLGKKERDLADWVLNELNGTIRDAAQASRFGIEYVDVSEALDGHELCTADPWVNDLALEYDDIPGNGGGSTERGHPTIDGQYAYADAVADGLGFAP